MDVGLMLGWVLATNPEPQKLNNNSANFFILFYESAKLLLLVIDKILQAKCS
jgi:hypothetical protein